MSWVPTASPAVTIWQYRTLMSAFPTGVAVITSLDETHQPCGMTCSSLVSVTLSPPTLAVCLRCGSRTESAVLRSGQFVVNLLRADAQRSAEVFAGPVADRFSQVAWTPSATGMPLLEDAFAQAECVVSNSLQVGDHTVLFGRVVGVSQTTGQPLLYGMRTFSAWKGNDDG